MFFLVASKVARSKNIEPIDIGLNPGISGERETYILKMRENQVHTGEVLARDILKLRPRCASYDTM